MSENGSNANGNNWTLLTPEVKESGAENMGPVTEGLKVEGQLSKAPEPSTLAHSNLEKQSSNASAHQPETETSAQIQSDPALSHGSEKTEETQITPSETSEGRAQLNAAHVNEGPSSVSVEDISSWSPDHEEQDALTGYSESLACPGTDAESFSDSCSHISPTTGSSPLPASVCKERDHFKSDEETLRKSTGEEPKEVLETNGKEGDGLRKRKISHLGSLDKTEIEDDEEREEEDFQPPQREEETVFTLNKCIIAAVILLGLGTIFFSEADVDVRELKDPANQDWLNLEDSRDMPVGLQPPDILSKHTKEDQQILALQAQLQQYQVELKAAQLLAETGENERVRREELEKEYQRIKGELDRLPVLQKELEQENERMKEESARAKKELEALPSLQSELEHLRSQVSQLTVKAEHLHPIATSRTPPAGDKRDVPPIERPDMKNRKTWDKKAGEKEQSKTDKEWKKKKSGKKEGDKDRREKVMDGEHTKEQKDRKKEEGKAGKQREEKREWTKKDKKRDEGKIRNEREEKWVEKKEWNDEKKWKKDKHMEKDDKKGNKKDWKDPGNLKVKEEKEHKQKEWKSDKHSGMNDHREWKENKKNEWKGKKGEVKHNEKKWKGDREEYAEKKEKEQKHRRGKERESKKEEWTRDDVKEVKKDKVHHHKNEKRNSPNEKEKGHKEKHRNAPPDETSTHHHHEQQNYWTKQRERIQHYDDLRDHCSGVEDCARVEGLSPVHLHDFENLLQSYMDKLQEEQSSRKEELRKLVREFFNDGVFAHDQMPFSDFVEDVGDILEDMAEGEESDTEAEDSEEDDVDDDDDDEMEDFEREAMEKFALPAEAKKVEDSSRKKR